MIEYQRYWTITESDGMYDVKYQGRLVARTDDFDFALAIIHG